MRATVPIVPPIRSNTMLARKAACYIRPDTNAEAERSSSWQSGRKGFRYSRIEALAF